MFGGLNALFTGLAFSAVIFSIYLQRKDLKLTQDTLERQHLEMKEQNKTLELQRLETMFFALLKTLNNSIENMVLNDRTGREVFLIPAMLLNNKLTSASLKHNKEKFWKLIKARDDIFGPYFRSFSTLVDFIDQSSLDWVEKYFYLSIVKNQLTTNELECLLAYSLVDEAQDQFRCKHFIEKYSLLTYVDRGVLFKLVEDQYKEQAFLHILDTRERKN